MSRYLYREYEPCRDIEKFNVWTPINSDTSKKNFINKFNGIFFQTTSNPQFEPSKHYHWFDGDGMIHAIKFFEGKVYYKCAYIETEKYKREKKAGKNIYPGLSNPINNNGFFTSLKKIIGYVLLGKNPFSDTSNTDIVYHNGKLFSLWFMSGNPYELDLNTLSTKGVYKFPNKNEKKQLKHKMSARPRICPQTGELFFMDFTESWKHFSKKGIYIGKVSKDGERLTSKKISVNGSRVLHDIGITKNYIIVTDVPVKPSLKGIVEDKKSISRIGIIKRDFSKIKTKNGKKNVLWFEDTERYTIIHIVNTYEENNKIYVYGLKKENISIQSNNLHKKSESQIHFAYLHKWVLDLNSELFSPDSMSLQSQIPFPLEFPSINPQKIGIKNTYSYVVRIANAKTFKYDAFIKINHKSYTYEIYEYPKNEYCSQIQFIASGNSNAEDEGFLLTLVYSKTGSRVDIFDAQKISEGPIDQLSIPNKIPIGFHTKWVSF